MIKVNQFKNLNMLEHGLSVRKHFTNIITDLNNEQQLTSRYDLPDILTKHWKKIKKNLCNQKILSMYQIYHDCGKPFCLQVDEDGRQHFPNHAEKSYETFLKYFAETTKQSDTIAHLIRNDMIFHSPPMIEIDQFIETEEPKILWTLWLTALAELYANKEMFDDSNQLSFKIKYKKLKKILNKLTNK